MSVNKIKLFWLVSWRFLVSLQQCSKRNRKLKRAKPNPQRKHQRTRIRNHKAKCDAEQEEMEFSPDLIIEEISELTLRELQETCEVIGYENLLLGDSFVENPKVIVILFTLI